MDGEHVVLLRLIPKKRGVHVNRRRPRLLVLNNKRIREPSPLCVRGV